MAMIAIVLTETAFIHRVKLRIFFWFMSYQRSVFGLGLACQAKGQCCHTKKKITLAKTFTKKKKKKNE